MRQIKIKKGICVIHFKTEMYKRNLQPYGTETGNVFFPEDTEGIQKSFITLFTNSYHNSVEIH